MQESTAASVREPALRTIIMQAYPNCPSIRVRMPFDELRRSLVSPCRSCFARMDSEDEEECYLNGIKASLHQHGIYQMDDYLNSERTAADFIDTQDSENNIPARCRVSPKWNPADDKEIKLEKIITQKWIALFPEGCEAWAEQRRTGYPRLFPVRFNHSKNGCIDTETMVRRLNFPGTLQTKDRAIPGSCGGFGRTRSWRNPVWWDKGNNGLD